MNDNEFIKYLCEQIWNITEHADCDDLDFEMIVEELRNRNINPDEIFGEK